MRPGLEVRLRFRPKTGRDSRFNENKDQKWKWKRFISETSSFKTTTIRTGLGRNAFCSDINLKEALTPMRVLIINYISSGLFNPFVGATPATAFPGFGIRFGVKFPFDGVNDGRQEPVQVLTKKPAQTWGQLNGVQDMAMRGDRFAELEATQVLQGALETLAPDDAHPASGRRRADHGVERFPLQPRVTGHSQGLSVTEKGQGSQPHVQMYSYYTALTEARRVTLELIVVSK
jgi:hypothetical protein